MELILILITLVKVYLRIGLYVAAALKLREFALAMQRGDLITPALPSSMPRGMLAAHVRQQARVIVTWPWVLWRALGENQWLV
ncbi:MAG: hypothetical protein ACK47B_23805 [Armatimonadota bacterium]